MDGLTKLLTAAEVGALLTVHPKTIMRMATRGELPGIHIGRYWRFDPAELSRWISAKSRGEVDNAASGTLPSSCQPCSQQSNFRGDL
jgi:excisionase family DNA binding protein